MDAVALVITMIGTSVGTLLSVWTIFYNLKAELRKTGVDANRLDNVEKKVDKLKCDEHSTKITLLESCNKHQSELLQEHKSVLSRLHLRKA